MSIRKDIQAIEAYDSISIDDFEQARKMVCLLEGLIITITIADLI
jgi:hypothetical protein